MKSITTKNYKEILSKTKLIVKVEASWCGPCRMLAPLVEKLADKYDEIPFYKVDIDEFKNFYALHSINGVPVLLFFHGGKEVHRIVGMASAANIENSIQALVKL